MAAETIGHDGTAPVPDYAIGATVRAPFDEVVARVKGALMDEGFGVLCEIDVQAALREKLGVERGRYLILGACNPPLAHQALQAEPDLGVFLPCNVVVYEDGPAVLVRAVDPRSMLGAVENPVLDAIAGEVELRFTRVVAALG
jgi:uncharacterized protein (DUF302 family)